MSATTSGASGAAAGIASGWTRSACAIIPPIHLMIVLSGTGSLEANVIAPDGDITTLEPFPHAIEDDYRIVPHK
jgi:hypothetical protein